MNTEKEPSNMYKTFKSSILFYIYILFFLIYICFVRSFVHPGSSFVPTPHLGFGEDVVAAAGVALHALFARFALQELR